jgi:uncharacterized heparinase superfamily protein
VPAERVADEARGILLDVRHDGYEQPFGLLHGRRLGSRRMAEPWKASTS